MSGTFWLFNVENNSAILRIKNSKFYEWRFRQLSVINLYDGEIVLENVDFENTEAATASMAWSMSFDINPRTEIGYTDRNYAVPGIITSSKNYLPAYPDNDGWKSTVEIPAPRGKFTWIGGSVTGHNIDMNPIDQY